MDDLCFKSILFSEYLCGGQSALLSMNRLSNASNKWRSLVSLLVISSFLLSKVLIKFCNSFLDISTKNIK